MARTRVSGRRDVAGAGAPLRNPAIRFLARGLGCWLVGTATLALFPIIDETFVALTTSSLRALAFTMPDVNAIQGSRLLGPRVDLQIVQDCTPLMPLLLVASAIVAFPASAGRRARGILLAAACLWIYNLARIVVLVWIQARSPAWFEIVHVFMWQPLTLGLVIGIFMLWMRGVDGGAKE